MLRILHIIPNLLKGGAERLCIDIVRQLNYREDIDVRILLLEDKNDYPFLCEGITIDVVPARISPSVLGKTRVDIKEFSKYISQFNPHIIHSHLFIAEFISRWETNHGTKYFTHCHDNIRQFKRPDIASVFKKQRFTETYERKILFSKYGQCDNTFIAISASVEEYLRQNMPPGICKVIKLSNAIDVERFKFKPRKHFQNNEKIRLLNIGSLVPKKNHTFLLEIMKSLAEEGIDAHLDILGDGVLKNALIEKSKSLGIEDRITFHGKIDHVEDFLSVSDIYIHSAQTEAFGLVLLEAMASGLPVISLDGGGNRDIINDGENGFLIGDESLSKFIAKIKQLKTNSADYKSMSRNAFEWANKHDIRFYINDLIGIYRNAMKGLINK